MVETGFNNSKINSDIWANGMVHGNTVTTNTDLHTSIERKRNQAILLCKKCMASVSGIICDIVNYLGIVLC